MLSQDNLIYIDDENQLGDMVSLSTMKLIPSPGIKLILYDDLSCCRTTGLFLNVGKQKI